MSSEVMIVFIVCIFFYSLPLKYAIASACIFERNAALTPRYIAAPTATPQNSDSQSLASADCTRHTIVIMIIDKPQ
jgi:hypothetical protein